MRPLVSIMMPAYNAARYIGSAIESALGQTETDWELIIVNDGSVDETEHVISRYADRRIRVFKTENGGEAAARNVALEHVRGDFIAFLDADDEYLPGHLAAVLRHFAAHPDCDAVYTDGYYIDAAGRRLAAISSRRRPPVRGDAFEAMVRSSDAVNPPVCVVLRADGVTRQGLSFDRSIVIGPDWDFLTRYSMAGSFGYVDERTCLYRVHDASLTQATGSRVRQLSLAKCREKGIRLARFGECSTDVRAFVFYDLLVNLLNGFPERQSDIVTWKQFADLPANEQSRLLRLMASEALLTGGEYETARKWLLKAWSLDRRDLKCCLLNLSCLVSPSLSRALLRLRRSVGTARIQPDIFRKQAR